ncbi:hypothetical protein [Streptomyces sp. TP-A0356]|nr:hypothetical protein [Streptomyces sp. TP-A0356]
MTLLDVAAPRHQLGMCRSEARPVTSKAANATVQLRVLRHWLVTW